MTPFRAALTEAGLTDVRTYIQSGNITCHHPDPPGARVAQALMRFDLTRPAHILDETALTALLEGVPVSQTPDNRIHVFLHPGQAPVISPPMTDTETLVRLNGATILDAPDGIGRSKAAAWLDKHLPQPVTARTLATLRKTAALLT